MSSASDSAPADVYYTIASKDNVEFRISEKAINHSETIRSCIANLGYTPDNTMGALPLPKVDGVILKLVIEFLEHHKDEEPSPTATKVEDIEITEWDEQFLNVDQETMFQLIVAANYLDTRKLLEVTCKRAADWIRGNTPEEMRINFNPNDDEADGDKESNANAEVANGDGELNANGDDEVNAAS